jgi:hypothetical protein
MMMRIHDQQKTSNQAQSAMIVLGYSSLAKGLFAGGFLAFVIFVATQLGLSYTGVFLCLLLLVLGGIMVGSISSLRLGSAQLEIVSLFRSRVLPLAALDTIQLVRARGAGLNLVLVAEQGGRTVQTNCEVALTSKHGKVFRDYLIANGFVEMRFDQLKHPTVYAVFGKR